MNAKPHLSASSIGLYLRCAKAWEFRYVKQIKSPPRGAMVQGKAWHSTVEANYSQKIESQRDLPLDEMTDRFAEEFEEAIKVEAPQWGEGEKPDTLKDQGVKVTEAHHKIIAPNVRPKVVEQEVRVSLGNEFPYDLLGYIDLIEESGAIVDNKCRSRAPSQKDVDKDLQLSLYSFAQRVSTQTVEPELRLDVVVKTKAPKALQVVTKRTNNDARNMQNLVENVVRGIKAGAFPANTDTWMCSAKWCGFWSRCRFGGGNE